jgi:hypothetical protein
MTDTRDMRKQEATARRDALYDSPSSQRIRAEGDRKPGAAEQMAARHSDERGKLGARHRQESVNLHTDFRIASDKHLSTARGLPRQMGEDHQKAIEEMDKKHRREMQGMKDRHLAERDAARKRT